ncbi:MAG: hemerythrin domain-containing protein [Calditrichaceae bacterium]|jgi:hemerythrin-like domain-containing protein
MKRKNELITLSWEHHDGLLFAFRLQQGLKYSAGIEEIREYTLHTWDNALNHHFWQEEQSLAGVLDFNETGRDLLNRMQSDHEYFRSQIEDIRSKVNLVPAKFNEFADRLNQHIRFEERELFPFLEKQVLPETLKDIGAFLDEHHQNSDKCWKNEFWKNKNES